MVEISMGKFIFFVRNSSFLSWEKWTTDLGKILLFKKKRKRGALSSPLLLIYYAKMWTKKRIDKKIYGNWKTGGP